MQIFVDRDLAQETFANAPTLKRITFNMTDVPIRIETFDYGIASQIQDEIRTTIRNYEPIIGIVELVVEPEFEQNSFTVHMEYEIVGRQDNTPQEINFLLQRTQ